MKYVDGFLLVVPKKNLEAYKAMAQKGAEVWRKHGALDYKECVGDDLNPSMGGMKVARFTEIVNAKDDELVVFSYIVFNSREHRDEVNAKVMSDPFMNGSDGKNMEMPFDMARMAYGGFQVLVDA